MSRVVIATALLLTSSHVLALRIAATPLADRAAEPWRKPVRSSLLRLSGGVDGEPFSFLDAGEKCVITMPIDEGVKSRDVEFSLAKNVLTLGVKGAPPVIDAEPLWDRVLNEDAFWEIDDVDGERCVVLEMSKRDSGRMWEFLLKSQYKPPDTSVTVQTYMEIEIDGEPKGRIDFGLYGAQAPKTVDNFRSLCTGEKGDGTLGKPLSFAGSPFHRIIPGFMLQGGDFTSGDGTGGESIYGGKFADEDFGIKHEKAGLLSMANSGPDSNGSQFFITVAPTPWLDGKHVVFGEVTSGMELVKELEALGSEDGKPSKTVTISACGLVQ